MPQHQQHSTSSPPETAASSARRARSDGPSSAELTPGWETATPVADDILAGEDLCFEGEKCVLRLRSSEPMEELAVSELTARAPC